MIDKRVLLEILIKTTKTEMKGTKMRKEYLTREKIEWSRVETYVIRNRPNSFSYAIEHIYILKQGLDME